MPRTKLGAINRKYDGITRLIEGYKATTGKTNTEIGKMINRCEDTISARLRKPGELKLDDLLHICRGMNIPIEEVRQNIRY